MNEGARADLVLFDEARVGTEALSTVEDLPDGSGRVFAPATGIDAVMVAGHTVVANGRPTGVLAGAVFERGVDTVSAELQVPRR